MGYAVVQTKAGTTGTTSATAAFTTANITTGNALVVIGVSSAVNTHTLSVADNSAGGTNTYTSLLTVVDSANNDRIYFWSAPIVNGGGSKPTITVTPSISTFGVEALIMEVSGIQTGAGSVDASASKATATNTTAPDSGNASATTAANELCVGGYADPQSASTIAAGAGWTNIASAIAGVDYSGEWKDSGASGSVIDAVFAATGMAAGYAAGLVVIKNSTGAAALGVTFQPQRMPLGV